jgi:hypothetical protein
MWQGGLAREREKGCSTVGRGRGRYRDGQKAAAIEPVGRAGPRYVLSINLRQWLTRIRY